MKTTAAEESIEKTIDKSHGTQVNNDVETRNESGRFDNDSDIDEIDDIDIGIGNYKSDSSCESLNV